MWYAFSIPGGWEWIIILFVVLLLFGRRVPGIARALGQSISSFRSGFGETDDDEESEAQQ